MKKLLLFLFCCALLPLGGFAAETNPKAVTDLLTRVTNAADKFVTVLDASFATGDEEVFVITAQDGKPCIKGSTISAITTGINWYLNHTAHINLTWNNLTTDLSDASLPLPTGEEKHVCTADYRYYLNYCTFSYSMSTWTWERWQQEIDWMALHGINMPLQIIGLDVLWRNLLVEHYGYSKDEANAFVAGPCFQAWWGMNNLEGWGGPNPDWWYTRQEQLCKQILERERELGMQPVLPGYAGMVPSDFTTKTGNASNNQGNWCNFLRPYILDPNSAAFADVSAKYYAELEELMGKSEYYSMDPFHEGANTSGIDVPAAYTKLAEAMTAANAEGKWVIQFWQWSGAQYHVLDKVEKGKLIVLDLYSDAHTHFGEYKGHDAVYCMIPNFGGRTGFFGRLSKIMTEYFNEKSKHSNVKGVGATPEAIEQVPVLYDALYELPWRDVAPDPAEWTKDYAYARYGVENSQAQAAWEKLRISSLACPDALQGPMEAVVCGRPWWNVGSVSTWGGTGIFYNTQDVKQAAHLLLASGLSGENYSYDLVDIARQALTDYSKTLLAGIDAARGDMSSELYITRRDAFLQLILDLDELLNTNQNFMLGRWTQMARGIADEVSGTTEADKDWLEQDNARTLITTWGGRDQAQGGGLKDYSYREWGGMMKDYYYKRWKMFFDNPGGSFDWFQTEWNWAHSARLEYSNVPEGNSFEVAERMLAKYFVEIAPENDEKMYLDRHVNNAYGDFSVVAYRGENFVFPGTLPTDVSVQLSIDFNSDGAFSANEISEHASPAVPATAVPGKVKAQLLLSDGTTMDFRVVLKDHVTEARTVSVSTEDAAKGGVGIVGSEGTSVTNMDDVEILALPLSGYDFSAWTDADGNLISTQNPYIYYGKDAASFVARFAVNKWGTIEEDKSEHGTIASYKQYVAEMSVSQNVGERKVIYTTADCPENLLQTTQMINVAAGSRFNVAWQGAGSDGLTYCYLSAYMDLNADGDFTDEGELIGTQGNIAAKNDFLDNSSINVLLPYDIPQGVTRMRLRFDGAWQVSGNAKEPTASTQRMVYDVPVNITEYAAAACTVTALASDVTKGTVDASGQPDTYTYSAGETVVFRAYPADGYELKCWTDQYGREVPQSWYDGNAIRFKASESGTYTAQFVSVLSLEVSGWQLNYDVEPDGTLAITSVKSGSGALDLSAENSAGKVITRISPKTFKNNEDLTVLTLPTTLISFDRYLETTAYEGAGVENVQLFPERTIPAASPFSLTLEGSSDGSAFNQWGSGLLATGTNALGSGYAGGFQCYLAKAGTLTVIASSTETYFSGNLIGNFKIAVVYDGANQLTFSVTAADGTTEVKTIAATIGAISTFATAIPAGVSITKLTIDDPYLTSQPLSGTSALQSVFVEEGSALFSDKVGVLYNAAGTKLLHQPADYKDLTGIEVIDNEELTTDSCPAYDLSGRPVSSSYHGVVITSRGKKVQK